MWGTLYGSAGIARWETHNRKEFNLLATTTGLPGTSHLPSHPRRRPGSAGLALFCTAPAWPGEGKGKKGEKEVRTMMQALCTHFAVWQFNCHLLHFQIFITKCVAGGRKIIIKKKISVLPKASAVRRHQPWQPQAASAPTQPEPCGSLHTHSHTKNTRMWNRAFLNG